jgi:hypothetical protein
MDMARILGYVMSMGFTISTTSLVYFYFSASFSSCSKIDMYYKIGIGRNTPLLDSGRIIFRICYACISKRCGMILLF